jgi:hypothetical protein
VEEEEEEGEEGADSAVDAGFFRKSGNYLTLARRVQRTIRIF